MKFIINAKGKVVSVNITGSTLNNAVVERCVIKATSEMSFPIANDGKINVVKYSFRFDK